MASGSQSMTTYYAKRIVGDASAAQANSALLQTGADVAVDTWILNRTNRVNTYGIKYVYDDTDGHDKVEFYGGAAAASAWVQLDTGNITAPKFIGALEGNADSATALTSNAGGTEQPIYFTGGKPAATSYALKATVNNGDANYVAYYSDARTISSAKASTAMIMPGHYYHNLYNNNPTTGTTVYVHYYNGDTTSTNTFANLRVKSGTSYKVLAFGGDGALSWDGTITANGGYLKSTANENTVTIGSQNTGWCHFSNSADRPFWFSNTIQMEKGKVIGGADTQYRPFQLYLGRNTTTGSNALNANNPLIEFSNSDRSQYCQLIYDDWDSLCTPDSLTLVGNQNGITFICKNGPIWVQGGSNAGGNVNRLNTSAGTPGNMQYNTSRRGTQIYSNGIAFADPYNGNSNNDAGWIRHIETTGNTGYLEIGVGDDGNEEIIVRQYNTSNNVARQMYLLNSSGFTAVSNQSTDAGYTHAAMQIRETNFTGAGSDVWGQAPRLAWHWGGRVQAQIGLASNNHLYISENNFTNAYRIVMETGTWGINITGSSASCTGNAATATNLVGISMTGGNGNTGGRRLIYTWTINAWSNYRLTFAVTSRHTGSGLVAISVGCNSSTVSLANCYAEIKYFGPTGSGSIISSTSYEIYINSAGTTAYLFWQYGDYNNTSITPLSGGLPSNGTWTENPASYGTLKAQTEINVSSTCYGNAATATKLAHTTLDSTTINNTAGSFAFSGSGDPWSGSDWVGLQIGDNADKFQISARSNTLQFRQNDSGGTNTSWSDWVTMLTSANYTSYTVTKTGSGASGSWGISVTGSSASCTGNAATATRINGNLAAATSNVNRNIWVSSGAGADGIPNYISYFNMNPSTNVFSVPAGTRISPNTGALYLGNSGNQNWVYVQDMCGQDGQKWKIHQNGNAEFTGTVTAPTFKAGNDNATYSSDRCKVYAANGTVGIHASTNRGLYEFTDSKWIIYLQNSDDTVRSSYKIYGAVWNDFAEMREGDITEGGYAVYDDGHGHMKLCTERLQPGARLTSDTFGIVVGHTETAKTPIGVAGRVLVYPAQDRINYKVGDAVCAAPGGKVDLMTREEIMMYPERILGIVSEIPDYEIWNQRYKVEEEKEYTETNIQVNGRIWVYIR